MGPAEVGTSSSAGLTRLPSSSSPTHVAACSSMDSDAKVREHIGHSVPAMAHEFAARQVLKGLLSLNRVPSRLRESKPVRTRVQQKSLSVAECQT